MKFSQSDMSDRSNQLRIVNVETRKKKEEEKKGKKKEKKREETEDEIEEAW